MREKIVSTLTWTWTVIIESWPAAATGVPGVQRVEGPPWPPAERDGGTTCRLRGAGRAGDGLRPQCHTSLPWPADRSSNRPAWRSGRASRCRAARCLGPFSPSTTRAERAALGCGQRPPSARLGPACMPHTHPAPSMLQPRVHSSFLGPTLTPPPKPLRTPSASPVPQPSSHAPSLLLPSRYSLSARASDRGATESLPLNGLPRPLRLPLQSPRCGQCRFQKRHALPPARSPACCSEDNAEAPRPSGGLVECDR